MHRSVTTLHQAAARRPFFLAGRMPAGSSARCRPRASTVAGRMASPGSAGSGLVFGFQPKGVGWLAPGSMARARVWPCVWFSAERRVRQSGQAKLDGGGFRCLSPDPTAAQRRACRVDRSEKSLHARRNFGQTLQRWTAHPNAVGRPNRMFGQCSPPVGKGFAGVRLGTRDSSESEGRKCRALARSPGTCLRSDQR